MGTPVDVPVPRKVNRRVPAALPSVNRLAPRAIAISLASLEAWPESWSRYTPEQTAAHLTKKGTQERPVFGPAAKRRARVSGIIAV
jgi:hypothetical protein